MDYRIYEYGKGSIFGPEELEAVKTAFAGDTLAYGPLRDKFEAEFADRRDGLPGRPCDGAVQFGLGHAVILCL